jgi:hypothetical protein
MLKSTPSNSASALISKTPKPFLGCQLLLDTTELRLEDLVALSQLYQLLVQVLVEIVKLAFLQLVINPAQHGGQFVARQYMFWVACLGTFGEVVVQL